MSETPEQLAAQIAQPFEGFSATPYPDPAGVWTIGYGSTYDADGTPVTANTAPISQATALKLLELQLNQALATIRRDVRVPLTDEETAALEDFIYNVGAGNFAASTLLQDLNAGDYDAAAGQFERWDRAGGKVLAGLVRRRAAEAVEFAAGEISQVTASVDQAAAGSGDPVGDAITARLNAAEAAIGPGV